MGGWVSFGIHIPPLQHYFPLGLEWDVEHRVLFLLFIIYP
jgi:hypothetical protein